MTSLPPAAVIALATSIPSLLVAILALWITYLSYRNTHNMRTGRQDESN
ncbi:hypothetical protein BFJ63_vAg12959 [Fusarium oxysporum f. sp. narcissi]|uniref:Uncharacterized protein n=1 Tax=Fusarium oxysporum f. sp. narcissi TaxID=451672 RepID=A0A4Q2VA31_FUSOX|nr:hypothetical protein BFJ63_vAg12959 [Fusarium oxysporum f. sp. narcissi]